MAGVRRYRGNGGGQSNGIYSADPGVGRHHLISISSYHTMNVHTLPLPSLGFTRSVRDFVDPCIAIDPQLRVVSCLLSRFLRSSNHYHSLARIPYGCRETCGGMLMVGYRASSSIISPQWPPSGAYLSSHVQKLVRLCSTTIGSQIDSFHIYQETEIMHTI
jgi:hypothetical protein